MQIDTGPVAVCVCERERECVCTYTPWSERELAASWLHLYGTRPLRPPIHHHHRRRHHHPGAAAESHTRPTLARSAHGPTLWSHIHIQHTAHHIVGIIMA